MNRFFIHKNNGRCISVAIVFMAKLFVHVIDEFYESVSLEYIV